MESTYPTPEEVKKRREDLVETLKGLSTSLQPKKQPTTGIYAIAKPTSEEESILPEATTGEVSAPLPTPVSRATTPGWTPPWGYAAKAESYRTVPTLPETPTVEAPIAPEAPETIDLEKPWTNETIAALMRGAKTIGGGGGGFVQPTVMPERDFRQEYSDLLDKILSERESQGTLERYKNAMEFLQRKGFDLGQTLERYGKRPGIYRKEEEALTATIPTLLKTYGAGIEEYPKLLERQMEQRKFPLEMRRTLAALGLTDAQINNIIAEATKTKKETGALPPSYEVAQAGREKLAALAHPPKDITAGILDAAVKFAGHFKDLVTGEINQEKFHAALPKFIDAIKKTGILHEDWNTPTTPTASAGTTIARPKPTWEQFYTAAKKQGSKLTDNLLWQAYREQFGG